MPGLVGDEQFAVFVLDVEELAFDDVVGLEDLVGIEFGGEGIDAEVVAADLGDADHVVGAFEDVEVIDEAAFEVGVVAAAIGGNGAGAC